MVQGTYLYDWGLKHKKKTVKILYSENMRATAHVKGQQKQQLFITRPSDESDNLTVTDIFVCRSLVSLVNVAIPQLLVSQHAQCIHTLFLDRRFFLAWAIYMYLLKIGGFFFVFISIVHDKATL
ncbi:MAG: hypothetical protein GQ523_08350 [Methanophagales archaeon]|nr:hypothetical protein [Methanophagales archaeon]